MLLVQQFNKKNIVTFYLTNLKLHVPNLIGCPYNCQSHHARCMKSTIDNMPTADTAATTQQIENVL